MVGSEPRLHTVGHEMFPFQGVALDYYDSVHFVTKPVEDDTRSDD